MLRPDGHLIVGFVDGNSPLGKRYDAGRNESLFYKNARFFAEEELRALLYAAGFGNMTARRIRLPADGPPAAVLRSAEAGDFTVLCAAAAAADLTPTP